MTDPIDQIWRSSANQQVPAQSRDALLTLAAGFARRDARRRRRLWVTGGMLGLFSLATGAAMFDPAGHEAALGALALLALSWTLWAMLAAQGRPDLVARSESQSFPETLQAMLTRNRRERRSVLQMSGAIVLAIAPFWIAVGQLRSAGQASAGEAWQLGAVLTMALVAGAGFLLTRLWRKLWPEHRRLERLLTELAEGPAR